MTFLKTMGIQVYHPLIKNINTIIDGIAMVEFISKPHLPLSKLRQSMGTFWDDVTPDEIDSLYQLCTPTTLRVVNALTMTPENEKVLRWLKLYLKECSHKMLRGFSWFCTASDVILPEKGIKVRMENMAEVAMRPRAQTCFRILTLPSNYSSYVCLQENMDTYLGSLEIWDMDEF